MPLQPTSLTLTPTWVNKGLTLTGGAPALREKVAIRVIGAATALGAVPAGFIVRLVPVGHPCTVYPPWHPAVATVPVAVEYVRFPLAAGDVWTVAGADLTATMDLNTAALEAAFAGTPIDSQIEARFVLESGSADNLYAVGRAVVRNWPQNGEDPVAGSSALKLRVDALEADLADETETRAAADVSEAATRAAADGVLNGRIAVKADEAALLQEIADRTAADAAHAARTDNPHGATWAQVNNDGQAEAAAAAAAAAHNLSTAAHADLRGKIKLIGDRLIIECPDGQYRKIIAVENDMEEFMLAIDNSKVYNWDEPTQEWTVPE